MLTKEWEVCRVRQIVMLVLITSLAAACGQTAALPSSDKAANYNTPTCTQYPTYTTYPTYTPYPTYTLPSLSADVESLVWPNGPRDDVISWTDAAKFVGTEMIIEGTIVQTHNSGKAVFLNFAEDYQGTFSVVVFPEDWHKFPAPPETLFYGRRVRAQGLIEDYQGAPEIVVRDPWQIEVALTLGQEEDCECGTPLAIQVVVTASPSATKELASSSESAVPTAGVTVHPSVTEEPAPSSESAVPTAGVAVPSPTIEVVNWQNAAAFAGKTVTVEGRIIATYNSGRVVFLNFDEDYQRTFKVVIFPDAWPLFPQAPEDMYQGQSVRVTGYVKMYQEAPEIIVETPDAIQILE
jgi:DNA/RNA endonuclease YhcR with UshA esterase domain